MKAFVSGLFLLVIYGVNAQDRDSLFFSSRPIFCEHLNDVDAELFLKSMNDYEGYSGKRGVHHSVSVSFHLGLKTRSADKFRAIISFPGGYEGISIGAESGIVSKNDLGGGKCKIFYSGKMIHPGQYFYVMTLSFVIANMPFGPQTIVLSEINVIGYNGVALRSNVDDSLSFNLNKLFGVLLGRKGDVNYDQEWFTGDEFINDIDYELVREYILGRVKFNQYQVWAADLNDDGKVDDNDLIELRKRILLNSIKDQIEVGQRFTLPAGSRLVVSDLLGRLVMSRAASYEDQEIDFVDLNPGQYVWIISSASSATFKAMGKMLIR